VTGEPIWQPKEIREKEWFLLEECSSRVRGYEGVRSHQVPHKLHGSKKFRQWYMGRRARNDISTM